MLGRWEWEAERSPEHWGCSWVSVLQAGGPRGSDRGGVRTLGFNLWKGEWKGTRLPVWKLCQQTRQEMMRVWGRRWWRRWSAETAGFREHGEEDLGCCLRVSSRLVLPSSAPVPHEPKLCTPRLLSPRLQGTRRRSGVLCSPEDPPLAGHLGLACPSIRSHLYTNFCPESAISPPPCPLRSRDGDSSAVTSPSFLTFPLGPSQPNPTLIKIPL